MAPYRHPSFGRASLLAIGAFLSTLLVGAAATGEASRVANQAADVLGRRCVQCHNGEKKSGGIDLSIRSGAQAAGVIGSSDPLRSRLVRAVTSGKMPPTGRLPAEEVTVLREWMRSGAPYAREPLQEVRLPDQPLWSLQTVRTPALPHSRFDRLAKNPIDRFVFAKLQEKGLQPSPPASRPALLRRVTIDLTGIPPTPEEIDAFVRDRSLDAYEKVVDRLLASPAYGERWGQHWLDVVRYGESHGYEQNHLRPNAWPYRDYVIRSLNEDKPYDRFVMEQLAGDLLANGSTGQQVNGEVNGSKAHRVNAPTNPSTRLPIDTSPLQAATGFLVAGIHDTVGNQTEEGTRQQRANDLDDMVCATAETFLGLTAGCAKCHDHKFDPIPQRDYYRLAAVFAGVRHGERPMLSPDEAAVLDRKAQEAARAIHELNGIIADLDAEARAMVLRSQEMRPQRPAVNPRRNVEEFPPARARFVRFTITGTKDGAEPCLDELEVYGPDAEGNLALAPGAKASASSHLPGYPIHQVAHLNDGRYGNDWSWISNERGAGWAQIELPQIQAVSRIVWSRDSAAQPRFTDRLPTAYRVDVSEDAREWKTVSTWADRASAPEAIPAAALQQALAPERREQRAALVARLEKLRAEAAAPAGKMVYAGQFTPPDPIFVLRRGDVMQRGEEVTPAALSRIPGYVGDIGWKPEQGEPGRRLALARWIVDSRNPLTARVLVNRVWHYHFGRGIVATPSDFGHNGEPPSHPELLDWLASVFISGAPAADLRSAAGAPEMKTGPGWSLKKLHRLITTSYVYRQASAPNARGSAVDAGNRLLWRMPLRRLEAEAIRDSILAVSGKLDRKIGGPPFQLYRYRVVNVAIYEPLEEYGPETWRRSVYRQTARSIRDDLLGTFDCPESAQRTPRREYTTTPLQALSLLNGPFMVQQSGFMADRIRAGAGEKTEDQVDRAFRLAFGRPAAPEERKAAVDLAAHRGLPALCRALLNANEFLYY